MACFDCRLYQLPALNLWSMISAGGTSTPTAMLRTPTANSDRPLRSGDWSHILLVALVGGLGAIAAAVIFLTMLWAVFRWLPDRNIHFAEAIVVLSLIMGFLVGVTIRAGGWFTGLRHTKARFVLGSGAAIVSVVIAYRFAPQVMGIPGQPGAIQVPIDLRILWGVSSPLVIWVAGVVACVD